MYPSNPTVVQVQQRGVGATKNILLQLLEGMNEVEGQPVLVVDMFPSRQCVQNDYFVSICFIKNDSHSYGIIICFWKKPPKKLLDQGYCSSTKAPLGFVNGAKRAGSCRRISCWGQSPMTRNGMSVSSGFTMMPIQTSISASS